MVSTAVVVVGVTAVSVVNESSRVDMCLLVHRR